MSEVKVTDNSKQVLDAFEHKLQNALWAIGATAEKHAKAKTPVDTGRLRNSMSHTAVTSDEAVYIGTNVEYAPYIEYGTSKIKAHHMLQQACQNHTDEYKNIAKAALK